MINFHPQQKLSAWQVDGQVREAVSRQEILFSPPTSWLKAIETTVG
jgi:hypothetical protein